MLNSLVLIDYIILIVIGLSILMSLWRGFLREALSLTAWIAAFGVAFVFVEQGATYLTDYVDVPSVRLILSFGGLFLATLFAGGVLNILVGQLVLRSGLTATDRMLGVIFGCLRGVAVIAVLVLLAGLTPLPKDPWWAESQFLPHFQQMALWLRDYMPGEYAEHFNFPLPASESIAIPIPS